MEVQRNMDSVFLSYSVQLSLILFRHSGFLTLLHPIEFIFFSGQQQVVSSILHTSFCSQPVWLAWFCLVPVNSLAFFRERDGRQWKGRAAPFWINRSVYRTLSSQQLFELHEQAEPKIQLVLGEF